MEAALSGSLLRTFFKSVMCLAKIGAEVLIEASAGHGLTLKAMNSARSAFCSVTFKQASFDVFHVRAGTLQTAVLAKHLAAALRTQKIERIVLSQSPGDASKLAVELQCNRVGVTKTYSVHCLTDVEHLKATIDASRMPVRLVARPREFGRILSHFQSGQNDITISCSPEGAENGFDDRDLLKTGDERGAAHRNLKLSSYADPNAPAGQALQTSVSLDTAEDAVASYEHDGNGPVDVTVNLKDLRAIVAFCESVDLDVALFCDCAGAPVLARPTAEFRSHGDPRGGGAGYGAGHGGYDNHHGRYFDAAAADFEAELVLASMLPPGTGEPSETMGGERTEEDGGGGGGNSVAGPTFPADSVPDARHSELTERGGGFGRPSAATSAGIPDSVDEGDFGGGAGTARGARAAEDAGLAWAPGAPVDEEDEFVEATPPEKKSRKY